MSTCSYIFNLATGIWGDLNNPTDVSTSFISGWLVSDQNLGKLNNVISTCFSGDGEGCISPALGAEEQSIYGELYKQVYFGKQINANLGAGAIAWAEIREADTVYRRASPTEVAKVYKDLLRESNATLKDLITSYKLNASTPRSNDFAAP